MWASIGLIALDAIVSLCNAVGAAAFGVGIAVAVVAAIALLGGH